MTIASGALARLLYVAESVHGTTPGSPAMTVLRSIGKNINLKKNPLRSEEVRGDRQRKSVRHGFQSVLGDIDGELSLQSYDDFLAAALGGAWTAVTVAGSPNFGANSTGDKFERSAGSFVTDGFREGDIIETASFVNGANNGQFRVTAVAATELDVVKKDGTAAGLTTEAAGAGPTLVYKGKRLDIGTTLTTFSIEREFSDLTQYEVFAGVAINTMSLSLQPEQIARLSFNLIGMSSGAMSGTPLDASPTAAPTNNPMTSFDGEIFEGGSVIAIATGIELSVNNNRSVRPVIGSDTSPDVFEGMADITGSLRAFLQDATLRNKFRNETLSKLWFFANDPDDGDSFLSFVLPEVTYLGDDVDPPNEGPCEVDLPFEAQVHDTYGTSLSIQRSNT